MNSFDTYLLRRIYKKIAKLGDKLAEADAQIDWTTFRPIIQGLYTNDTPRGGRPNADEVVMIKLLVLQQWYGLSDEELERQAYDRISFQRFLGYPDPVPDSTTIWLFRERARSLIELQKRAACNKTQPFSISHGLLRRILTQSWSSLCT